MNKKTLLAIIFIITLLFIGCGETKDNNSSKVSLQKETLNSVKRTLDAESGIPSPFESSLNYKQSISINKGINDITSICTSLFTEYLNHLKNDIIDEYKISDYKINEIKMLSSSNDSSLKFRVNFSVKPTVMKNWLVANGVQGSDGWMNNKIWFITASMSDDKITMENFATSP